MSAPHQAYPGSTQYWTNPHGQVFYRDGAGSWTPMQQGAPSPSYQMGSHGHYTLAGGPNGPQNHTPGVSSLQTREPVTDRTSESAVAGPSQPPAQIDPALTTPLPRPNSDELVEVQGKAPAVKIAGSRRAVKPDSKGKAVDRLGKRKRPAYESEDEDQPVKKRGRAKGTVNYSDEEIEELLDLVEDSLPLGNKAWKAVWASHRHWAKDNHLNERSDSSLDTKFKQLVKATKPTGNGKIPALVERAKYIEELIRERSHSRTLDDAEFADENDGNDRLDDLIVISGDEEEDIELPASAIKGSKKGPVARAIKTEAEVTVVPRRGRGPATGMQALDRLTATFDPSAVASREADRASRNFQATHIMSLTHEIRDLNTTVNSLRTQLTESERRCHEAERRGDRAVQDLNILRLFGQLNGREPRGRSDRREATEHPDRRGRVDIRYPDGGTQTTWDEPDNLMSYYAAGSPRQVQYTAPSPEMHVHRDREFRSYRDRSRVRSYRGRSRSMGSRRSRSPVRTPCGLRRERSPVRRSPFRRVPSPVHHRRIPAVFIQPATSSSSSGGESQAGTSYGPGTLQFSLGPARFDGHTQDYPMRSPEHPPIYDPASAHAMQGVEAAQTQSPASTASVSHSASQKVSIL